ncbi:MAG: cytochrome c [Gemmatimonadota bacterium]
MSRRGRVRACAARAAGTLALAALLACGGSGGAGTAATSGTDTPTVAASGAQPDSLVLVDGRRLFDANCSRCHGPAASGTEQGPPLVHMIYEPNHHGDAAFQRAVAHGTPAHHWGFGDMPPVPGLAPAQVEKIVVYVRHLQRQAGIGT